MRSTRTFADARQLAATALLMALGAVLGLVEASVVPPLPVAGIRLGLGNIAVVLALALLGAGPALRVGVGRVLIVALAGGALGGPAFAMALAGAVAAWGAMAAVARLAPDVTALGWSVAGAAAHVVAQLVVAALLLGTWAPLLMAPLSLGLALVCGLTVGYSTRLLLSRLPLADVAIGK
jgi:heptaprenyl diphosphate synthase